MEKTHLTLEPQELILGLREGQYKSSIDVILDFIGRTIQKISRQKLAPAPWICALILSVLISIIALVGSVLVGGTTSYVYRIILIGGLILYTNLVITKAAFDRVISTLQSRLLVKLASNLGIKGLQKWLITANDLKWPALIGFVVFVAYAFLILPTPTTIYSIPAELIMGGTMLFWTGFSLYYMFLFMFLSLSLSQLDFKLHVEDPVSSEVLIYWSRMMNLIAYLFAVMLATGTFYYVSTGEFSFRVLLFVIPRWLLLIALFVVNQIALSLVIRRSKQETLIKVERMMKDLRPIGSLPDNESMETVLFMWDYHDRVKGTRNASLNFKGIANFVNTLLIPIIAFIIANREVLLEYIGKI